MERFDYLIVGCGIAGITMAERLANAAGKSCLVIDRRPHIGGNCYDCRDEHGVLIHPYGPHYFRTNSEAVVHYLSRFTEWRPTEYRVLSFIDGSHYNFPINLNTFEQIIGRPSTEEEMKRTLTEWRVPIKEPQNSEEVIVSQVGWRLYEMFFKNYTIKQWGCHPRELEPSVCGRIPIRTNRDDRYLGESFQALPRDGYTALFERMLASPRICVKTGVDFQEAAKFAKWEKLIYTGMIDAYYDFRFGRLPYRSLRFEHEHHAMHFFQPAMQVNFPNEQEFTRIIEIKHATGQRIEGTSIIKEYPQEFGPGKEAYYPVPTAASSRIYQRYRELADREQDVIFIGRLASYRYYNMDQVVAAALTRFAKLFPAAE
ncbi:MAG: UDP-galactopyranose mutase [Verrucomicrobiales bacterium]|nr:UDP-galactopyranose mutase [Verrucomicrobiales bacterium]